MKTLSLPMNYTTISNVSGFALVRLIDNPVTPFATYRVDQAGNCHHGDYLNTTSQIAAVAAFRDRVANSNSESFTGCLVSLADGFYPNGESRPYLFGIVESVRGEFATVRMLGDGTTQSVAVSCFRQIETLSDKVPAMFQTELEVLFHHYCCDDLSARGLKSKLSAMGIRCDLRVWMANLIDLEFDSDRFWTFRV